MNWLVFAVVTRSPMHPRAPLTGFDYFQLLEDALRRMRSCRN